MVTLSGACHAHNVGRSLLTAIGVESDWVCSSREEYIAAAAAWAASPAALAHLRTEIRGRMLASPLCDAAAFMPGLERELEACFLRWAAGPAPPGDGAPEEGHSAPAGKVSAL